MKTNPAEPPRPIRRIVLTGGIATGKSYVLERFSSLGFPTVDADQLAHSAIAPTGPAWQQIRERFGTEVFDEHGMVDRRKLGTLVFASYGARAALNKIVHPHVRVAISEWFTDLDRLRSHCFGIVAIPLYFESSNAAPFDRIIVTACRSDTQLARVRMRGLSLHEARQRIDAQLPTDQKVRHADYAIWTDGRRADTDRRVQAISKELDNVSIT